MRWPTRRICPIGPTASTLSQTLVKRSAMPSDPRPNKTPDFSRADFRTGPSYVIVSRRVVYWQGLLLGVVAVGAFGLGILLGRGTVPRGRPDVAAVPQPCVLQITVSFVNGDQATVPDVGAVAIVLPQSNPPDSKIAWDGLRPQEPRPADDHPGLAVIRSLGGNYARADQQGRVHLRVSGAGRYYVLVISSHQASRQVVPPRHVLAELGRFFLLVPDLFAGQDYRWREEVMDGERELNIVFP